MNTHSTALQAVDTDLSRRRRPSLLRIVALESLYELLKTVRMPAYLLPTLLFPAMFYLLFGISFGKGQSYGEIGVATYLLSTYGAFGVIGCALFGFGIASAIERGQGWLLLKQASPMPIQAMFAGKLAVSLLMSAVVVEILAVLGLVVGDVPWQPGTLAALFGILLAGSVAFNAFGLVIGLGAGPNSAPAIANIIYLPMAFASGLWIPMHFLPDFLHRVAPTLPAYHLAQLALKPVGGDVGTAWWIHAAYLVVFTSVCFALAVWFWKRDEGRTFG